MTNRTPIILVLIAGCSSSISIPPPPADGGAGGMSLSSASASSAKASASSSSSAEGSSSVSSTSSASSGGSDAGADGYKQCPSCASILAGPDHLGAIAAFCVGGPEYSAWAAYIACGCAAGGSCATACASGEWCQGIFKSPPEWIDPGGACAACLSTPGVMGCGDQRATCAKM